jgi:hypothetical protein
MPFCRPDHLVMRESSIYFFVMHLFRKLSDLSAILNGNCRSFSHLFKANAGKT